MTKPLAHRMRPRVINDIVGQAHLVGEGGMIRRMVDAEMLTSMILFGPPGTGKTSLATAIAGSTGYQMRTMNAATGTKKQLELIVQEARLVGPILLLLDEIHRLDKPKQDYLLPTLENGRVIMIGATTENPYISINPAIRSRAQLFELKPLSSEEINMAVDRALSDDIKGLGDLPIEITNEAKLHLSQSTNGDLRSALNGLELAAKSTLYTEDKIIIDLKTIEQCVQKKAFDHSKDGDSHYDVMSAFQKSIRGSDSDAALHYLARMLEAGELIAICRRLQVTAYEDIGLAAPEVAARVVQAVGVARDVGMPEAQIPLSHAVIELCLSPKSNAAYLAIKEARRDIQVGNVGEVPPEIKDAHYKGAANLGNGVGYLYPHDYKGGWVNQQYIPTILKDRSYLKGEGSSPYEIGIMNTYNKLKELRNAK